MKKISRYTLFTFTLSFLMLQCDQADVVPTSINSQLLDQINVFRLSGCICGQDSMPPVHELQFDSLLKKAAEQHVNDMVENNFLFHIGSDGSLPGDRVKAFGYEGVFIGENIARGFWTLEDVLEEWMSSEPHCKSIMSPLFHYMGVSQRDNFWVQVFGSE